MKLCTVPLLLLLAACPGTATPERVCESNTSACVDGVPMVCLSTGEYQPTAREGCAEGTQCCLSPGIAGPIHGCAEPSGTFLGAQATRTHPLGRPWKDCTMTARFKPSKSSSPSVIQCWLGQA
jgi:hypothetical protein